jgi:hydroxysqualene dehydroxylase
MQQWAHTAKGLHFEAITTTYAFCEGARLSRPMLTLRGEPAQFVFDRGQLGGPTGLLAFVVSASAGDREGLEAAVVAQANTQLKLAVQPIQTIVEKRATFACTPGLMRPGASIAPGLSACGDYCDGPYPATLEGAVRSARSAVTLVASRG